MTTDQADTIAAIATPAGSGGVGIIRISGTQARQIASQISGIKQFKPRYAQFCTFKNHRQQIIDSGLILQFNAPASFTGEDVIEIQAHGGYMVMQMLLQEVLNLGARQARAGEFSERAFLNGKIDLAQAEAIADLISSGSQQAVMAAQRALQGDFSACVQNILKQLIDTRVWVEAAIDFPEEEIDFLSDQQLHRQMQQLHQNITDTLAKSQTGATLSQGIKIAIIGKPNVGKSSLLNCLTNEATAITSEIAGTTRDTIKADIIINGIPVQLIDTAGIRKTDNPIEQQGIAKAKQSQQQADLVLHMVDSSEPSLPQSKPKQLIIVNKIDLLPKPPDNQTDIIYLSALKQTGIEQLKQSIVNQVTQSEINETTFTARKRHLQQLKITHEHIEAARQQLQFNQGELSAEELKLAQQALAQITGEFSSDDLLTHIFSDFCIGK